MKKLIPLLLVVLTFAACEKDPDTDKLDNKYLVYTNYDTKADFKAFQTYYMPDSILIIGDKKVGSFGQIHPSVASEFEIGTDVYAATLDVTKMYGSADSDKHYEPLPVFPGIERDLALVMDKDIEAQTVIDSIVRFSGKSLCSVKIFDVYTGKGVPDGKKSVAFRLPDKTMNDAEAEQAVSKILKKLKENCDIEIRS